MQGQKQAKPGPSQVRSVIDESNQEHEVQGSVRITENETMEDLQEVTLAQEELVLTFTYF